MSRQHATPLLVPAIGEAVALPPLGPEAHGWSEAAVQALVQAHPASLPIREIDPLFADPVPLCTEMATGAGPIDNVLITASGLPVLVECKLWRNPQARREVVGQILDYAKELSRWTASDLQREVSRRTGRTGNAVVDLVREAGHAIDEIGFTDAVTLNLRRGRFLLLIVGDGIREGVEAIAEYLQGHSGLHFTLGLVEMPIFAMPDGSRLVAPRVLARTVNVTREVLFVPDGLVVAEPGASGTATDDEDESTIKRVAFMRELVSVPINYDPDQPLPRVSDKGWLYLYLPAPASSCWVGIMFKEGGRRVGVRLSSNVNTVGEAAIRQVVRDWPIIKEQLGGKPDLREQQPGRFVVDELRVTAQIDAADQRQQTLEWLRERIKSYVDVFRPRIKAAVELLQD